MSPKVILLTGAPAASEVNLASSTISRFDASICQFMGLEQDAPPSQPPPSAPVLPPWRVLPLVRQSLPTTTGFFSENHNLHAPASSDGFFTTAEITAEIENSTAVSQEGTTDTFTQFCEQSLALHGPEAGSVSQQGSWDISELTTSDISFATSTSSYGNGDGHSTVAQAPLLVPPHLSDLEDIPPARHITALNPQTVTVNLIVGIISIAQPRTITTRWGRNMSLVEILVGDETKSGFAITFWIPVSAVAGSSVSHLRLQDVVLLQNVALHVFRDKVYGQSLRKDMTKISLLWRRDGGGQYSTRDLAKNFDARRDPQKDKTRTVKNWTLHFVGGQTAPRKKNGKKSWDEPPDDTQ